MFVSRWKPFSQEEISIMGANAKANPKSREDTSEKKCPSCSQNSVRNYYREYSRGVSWCWCRTCHKYIHFSIAPLSKAYIFNDPIADVPEMAGFKWYEFLDLKWEEGVLPQVFKKKKGNKT